MKNLSNISILIIYLTICLVSGIACSGGGSSGGDSIADNSGTRDQTTSDDGSYSGTLVINEIVAKPADSGNDWIELYVTNGTVRLGDYSIVDGNSAHEPQDFPEKIMSEGEFYVVEAIDSDDDCPNGETCVSFRLGSDDSVILYKNDTPVDRLDWVEGQADEGFSFGRLPDGTGTAQTLFPTRAATNKTANADTVPADDTNTDTIENTYAPVVINEIVAKDPDDGEDWIEFFVTGTNPLNLNDYTIVDDNNENKPVELPDVYLTPGEFYVVLASDVPPADGSAYVPLKLGADDCLSLFRDEDLIDKLDWDKGAALIGYSYGRFPDGSDNTRTLSPTAGYQNAMPVNRQLVINEIMTKDSDGGHDWFELYNAGNTVIDLGNYRVADDDNDREPSVLPDISLSPGTFAVIYATGEDTGEAPYSVNFKLGGSDSLSLILDDEVVDYMNWDDSDAPAGYAYGLYPDGTWTKGTLEITPGAENQPVEFFSEETVENIYISIDEEYWDKILQYPEDKEYQPASITYRNVTLDDVAFRTKGNSSLGYVANMNSSRFSFKVDMNYYVGGQKLLGVKKINLNNCFKDPSYMRERIAYGMMRSIGIPAPRVAYVNLYINESLHGLYLLVEHVDSEFLENNFDNPEGDLYKPDGTGSDLLWHGPDFSAYTGVELKTNEDITDNAAFIQMIDALNNGNDPDPVVDVDEVLRYFAVSTALSNLDSYQGPLAHNYYIYEQDGRFSIIPWDLNEAFGSFTRGCQGSNAMISLYINEPTAGPLAERPLIARLLEHEDYKRDYQNYIEDLIFGSMNPAVIAWTIENTKNLISRHVANDPTAFFSYATFEASLGNAMIGNVFGLQGFVDERVRNMMDQLSGSEPSSGDGSGGCGIEPDNGSPPGGDGVFPPPGP